MQIPLSGLNAARTSLDVRANNIANLSSEGFDADTVALRALEPRGGVAVDSITPRAEGSGVDLVTETVGVVTARAMYDVNARMLRSQAETERHLLDVLA